ncbi:cation:proton antiporter [Mycobacterium sp. C31M]
MPLGDALAGLTTLAAIVLASHALATLFARCGQPRVLGPITLGIATATALAACEEALGWTPMTDPSLHLLQDVGTAGLLLLMFSVGAELRGAGKTGGTATGWRLMASVLLPIAVCAAAAWPFADLLRAPRGSPHCGWVFVGIALGVTAVPVLVLIIRDLGIAGLPVARAALHISVVTDGLAWILVSGMVIAGTDRHLLSGPALAVGMMMLGVVTVVIPYATRRLAVTHGGRRVVLMVVAALAGGAATQLLGFHPAIGAIVAGFCFPAAVVDESAGTAFGAALDLLLPAFFVSAAIAVPLQALRELGSWPGVVCLVTLGAVAVAAKLISGMVFGAVSKWPVRMSASLGALLNCRGVTEIAVATVGFDSQLIGPFAFAVLCGLAMVSVVVTAPLYRAFAAREVATSAPG